MAQAQAHLVEVHTILQRSDYSELARTIQSWALCDAPRLHPQNEGAMTETQEDELYLSHESHEFVPCWNCSNGDLTLLQQLELLVGFDASEERSFPHLHPVVVGIDGL